MALVLNTLHLGLAFRLLLEPSQPSDILPGRFEHLKVAAFIERHRLLIVDLVRSVQGPDQIFVLLPLLRQSSLLPADLDQLFFREVAFLKLNLLCIGAAHEEDALDLHLVDFFVLFLRVFDLVEHCILGLV